MIRKWGEIIKFSNESESENFDDARAESIKKDFNELREIFSALIKEIRKDLYRIENKKKFSATEIKKTETNVLKLEKTLSKLKKYYDYDDIECRAIRDVKKLFDLSIDEDYYKLVRTN